MLKQTFRSVLEIVTLQYRVGERTSFWNFGALLNKSNDFEHLKNVTIRILNEAYQLRSEFTEKYDFKTVVIVLS